ncbi:hypothetical protein FF100_09955 [Methylobacterium terricola]|uniref:Uncharacterized protein n=1 Tax=Methylobacterium terricola TaxID=2583531 RepID=A0A5C4LPC4_9HYPH|nr:hypothetical protein [Methylobacterium terricola]TNC14469.1 hypothetical protein FF100_09955 [Methylobacterium terricola]
MPQTPYRAAQALAVALLATLGASQAVGPAHAQATTPSGSGTAPSAGAGSCTMTPRGSQKPFCMNRVSQAACDAYAREQRVTYAWKAGTECP